MSETENIKENEVAPEPEQNPNHDFVIEKMASGLGNDLFLDRSSGDNIIIEVHPWHIFEVISFIKGFAIYADFLDSITAVDLMAFKGPEKDREAVPWKEIYPQKEEASPTGENAPAEEAASVGPRLYMLVYHLFSFRMKSTVIIKSVIPEEKLEIKSIDPLYGNANWLEREVFEMFGIQFKDSRDLRRLLLPEDWKGYPLRKDYKEEASYHGMATTRPEPLIKLREASIRKSSEPEK